MVCSWFIGTLHKRKKVTKGKSTIDMQHVQAINSATHISIGDDNGETNYGRMENDELKTAKGANVDTPSDGDEDSDNSMENMYQVCVETKIVPSDNDENEDMYMNNNTITNGNDEKQNESDNSIENMYENGVETMGSENIALHTVGDDVDNEDMYMNNGIDANVPLIANHAVVDTKGNDKYDDTKTGDTTDSKKDDIV